MTRIPTFLSILCALSLSLGAVRAAGAPVAIECEAFRYGVGADGIALSFIDKASGTDYLDRAAAGACARAVRDGKAIGASAISREEDRIAIAFGDSGVRAILEVRARGAWVEIEVASVEGDPESLVFLDVPLTLRGSPRESFGTCALGLTLATNVDGLPALQSRLRASCERRFGIAGAKVAIAGAPPARMLEVLKDVLTGSKDLPHSLVAGPWAKDAAANRGSYLFNFGDLTEANVDDWIARVKALGFTQIDSHGGGSRFFRFGDFELNRGKWPRGWDSFRAIVDRLHAAGIGAVFHTYAFFIDKRAKYVTPVPSPHLAAFRTFTLAEPIEAGAKEIRVVESTADLSTITGFFVRNSVTLHVGDELIAFAGASKEPPFRFTGCTRGALGTRAAAHPARAKARHLKECFGLFAPDPASPLFEEIAAGHAEIVNRCGFDGIYLDAIDGSDILAGPDASWYHASRFLVEIAKRLDRPVGMEMSAMWHHFWRFRSRWQAWDYPVRGHKRFIDLHAESVDGGLLLPLHLGWWNFQVFSPPQVEPTYPDVIEYLGAKLIGHDAGISLTGAIDAESLRKVPLYARLVGILREYEDLRHAGVFGDDIKRRLREPGAEFTLGRDADGKPRFRPVRAVAHKVTGRADGSARWTVENSFAARPPRIRVEVLMAAGPYDAPENTVLVDGADPKSLAGPEAAQGVTAAIERSALESPGGGSGLRIRVANASAERKGAWARIARRFEPPVDLGDRRAIGAWVRGDGSGALLNVRLESPRHIAHGAIADHYLPIDFEGWRYIELVETESSRHSDYAWPDGWALYAVYRESVNFGAIESASVWLNDVPPGGAADLAIGPVKAVRMIPIRIERPRIEIAGEAIAFPVAMESGDRLEVDPEAGTTLYDRIGAAKAQVVPEGKIPRLAPGANDVTFSCEGPETGAARIRVTISCLGDPL
ncbi:MAG: hypothetical protein JXP34_26475 [Planctomycetes bacterium]|nr:hypothetical protein [Planctomycetota bacterium]